MLHVDEPRLPGRTQVLVLDTGDLGFRRNPSIALPVDPDEDVALLEVRAVDVLRRVRAGAELEQNGYQLEPFDGGACRRAFRSQLLQRRGDENAQPLVRRQAARRRSAQIGMSVARDGRAVIRENPYEPERGRL